MEILKEIILAISLFLRFFILFLATRNLGVCLELGKGCMVDQRKAYELYCKSAESNYDYGNLFFFLKKNNKYKKLL